MLAHAGFFDSDRKAQHKSYLSPLDFPGCFWGHSGYRPDLERAEKSDSISSI
jgi:hypothetical protein